jgi:hypothetical protein
MSQQTSRDQENNYKGVDKREISSVIAPFVIAPSIDQTAAKSALFVQMAPNLKLNYCAEHLLELLSLLVS